MDLVHMFRDCINHDYIMGEIPDKNVVQHGSV